jgi:hypothetical protein
MVLSAALILPLVAAGQERRDERNSTQTGEQSRRYEDRDHKDVHEWNTTEDTAYRRYLEEHHRKYHDFDKANKREQKDYWNWRHSRPDDGR